MLKRVSITESNFPWRGGEVGVEGSYSPVTLWSHTFVSRLDINLAAQVGLLLLKNNKELEILLDATEKDYDEQRVRADVSSKKTTYNSVEESPIFFMASKSRVD